MEAASGCRLARHILCRERGTMDIRYSVNQRDFKRYTTQEMRDEFLITGLYQPDQVTAVYSHVDRMVTLGCMPVQEEVSIDKGIDVWGNFGTDYLLERRELGMFPAHCAYTTTLIPIEKANKRPLGAMETSNKRVINQFIHPDVLKTCQLSMGMTVLEPGSVWNTMPAHTHERRMEIYMYFEIPKDNVVFHMMGEGNETRHIVMQNEEAVISPSWSIHAGAGTSNYTFIWAMGGENQAFDDMDNIPTTELR